jgi:thioredoxin 1
MVLTLASGRLANEYHGKARIAKMNIDDNPATLARFNIRGIPALLIFKNGIVREHLSGAQSKDRIAGALAKHID